MKSPFRASTSSTGDLRLCYLETGQEHLLESGLIQTSIYPSPGFEPSGSAHAYFDSFHLRTIPVSI